MLTNLHHAQKNSECRLNLDNFLKLGIILKSGAVWPTKKSKIRLANTCHFWKLCLLEKPVFLQDYTADFVSNKTDCCTREGFEIPDCCLCPLTPYQEQPDAKAGPEPWGFWECALIGFYRITTLQVPRETDQPTPSQRDFGNTRSLQNVPNVAILIPFETILPVKLWSFFSWS